MALDDGKFKPKNEAWKLRLKHGRDRIIKSHEELWENFLEYAQWITENTFTEQNWVGKDGDEVARYKMRPMLKPEFAVACNVSAWSVIERLKDVSDDFFQTVTRIESCIAAHNISGSAAGFLNPNIITRLEGLTEKSEQSINIKGKPSWMDEDGSEQKS